MSDLPQLTLLWRDEAFLIHRKSLPWRRPCTEEAVAEYLQDYFDLIDDGYKPTGFELAPRPHAARVHFRGTVLVEWKRKPQAPAESLVTAAPPLGREGAPAAVLTPTVATVGVSARSDCTTDLPSHSDTSETHAVNDARERVDSITAQVKGIRQPNQHIAEGADTPYRSYR